MAFPYTFADNFETGSNAGWDSESDTGSLLDFPHYSTLANIPGVGAPYKGAYCMRVKLGDTNDHTVTEGSIDIADGGTAYSSFMLYLSKDAIATANDTISIYELQGTADAVENVIQLRYVTSGARWQIGASQATVITGWTDIYVNTWYHIEIESAISSGGGTVTLYVNGLQVSTENTIVAASAVLQGVLGVQDGLATTTGTILFDNFKFDDARIYPPVSRFPSAPRMTQSGHAFVGPGWIEGATLLSANGTMDLYDTDTGNTNDAQSKLAELSTSGNFVSYDQPVYFERGCYVKLGGTNPYGEVRIVTNSQRRGIFGPTAWGGDGAIRAYGQKRVPRVGNV